METVTLLAEVRERIRSRKHQNEMEVLSSGGRTRPSSPLQTGFGALSQPAVAVSPAGSPVPGGSPLPHIPDSHHDLPLIKTNPEYTKDDLEDVKVVFGFSD